MFRSRKTLRFACYHNKVDEGNNGREVDAYFHCYIHGNLYEIGEYVTTIGEKGQGPGEIQRPMNVVITPKGEILINDRGARFLLYFTLSGEYIRSLRQTRSLSLIRPKVDSQNDIVARIIVEDREGFWSFVLIKFDPDLNMLFTIFTYEYELSPGTLNFFMPDCFWEVFGDDSIIWGFSDKYEFEVLDKTGRIIRRIIKDYTPVEITKEEKEKYIKDLYGERGIPPDIKVSWDRFHNAFRFMTVDDMGRIFVRTYEKTSDEDGYYYDVFDSDKKELRDTINHGKSFFLLGPRQAGTTTLLEHISRPFIKWAGGKLKLLSFSSKTLFSFDRGIIGHHQDLKLPVV